MPNESISRLLLVTLSFGITIFLLYLGLKSTHLVFQGPGSVCWFRILRTSLLTVSVLVLGVGTGSVLRSQASLWIKNALLFTTSTIILVVVLEVGLTIYPLSSGGDNILTSMNWFNIYWDVNSHGYRDHEPQSIDRLDKKNVLVLGDSYVAGHGIRDPKERYTDICSSNLKNHVDVFNLGLCGADTKDELEMLRFFSVKPDVVVLVHFVNDIGDSITKGERISSKNPANYPKRVLQKNFLIKNSLLFNYLEFLIYRIKVSEFFRSMGDLSLTEILTSDIGRTVYLSGYTDKELFDQHLLELEKIYKWCDSNDTELLLVLFPNLLNNYYNEIDMLVNAPIATHAQSFNIETLNLTPILQPLTESQRTVGPTDSHPSVAVHKLVADTLSVRILQTVTSS